MRLEWINETGQQSGLHYAKRNGVNLSNAMRGYTRDFLMSSSNPKTSTSTGDIIETNRDFCVELFAPGMRKEDFTVELNGNMLRISCERDDSQEVMKYDCTYRSLARNVLLPKNADTKRIRAKYENGILNIILPKRKEWRAKIFKEIERV